MAKEDSIRKTLRELVKVLDVTCVDKDGYQTVLDCDTLDEYLDGLSKQHKEPDKVDPKETYQFKKVCDISTTSEEETEHVVKAFQGTPFSILYLEEWGDGGWDLVLMRRIE